MSTDTAAFIFSCIYHSVDHNLGSIRDNSWVNGNSVTGAGNSTGAGTSAPTCRTVAAWAVAGGLKNTKGNQMGSWFFSGFGGFCFLLPLIICSFFCLLYRFRKISFFCTGKKSRTDYKK